MKRPNRPSPFPLVLWILATTLSLADLILRLTDGHIIPDILYVPIGVTLLFAGITTVYMRRFLKAQKTAARHEPEEASADGPEEAPANDPE